MDVTSTDDPWSVIENLQRQRAEAVPGSREEDIHERALDLALSRLARSQDLTHLQQDVLRNAEFSHDRSRRRGRVALDKYSAGTGVLRTDEDLDLPDLDNVEDFVVGNELRRHLRSVASGANTRSLQFLDHRLAGHTVTEAGVAAGMSRATAYRTLAVLRGVAAEWTGRRAA